MYLRWVFLPVIAHWFSWLFAMGGIIVFPIAFTMAQVLILMVYSETVKPWRWLWTLPLTLGWWFLAGPVRCPVASDLEGCFLRSIALFFVVQTINAFFLLLVVRENPWPAINRWFGSMMISGVTWFILYFILVQFISADTIFQHQGNAVFLIFPFISLVSNALGGLYLIRVRERAHVW